MTFDDLFRVANGIALIAWLVLIAAPRDVRALQLALRVAVPGAFAVGYALLVMLNLGSADGGFESIAGVRTLFASDAALTAGWLHYLAFDLLVGCWLAARMDAAAVSRIVQAPVLAVTFMLGPLGLLLGVGVERLTPLARRAVRTR